VEVALFVTCLTDTFFPRVGEAVVRVLRHFGCRVVFPAEQTCCGQPAFNSGFRREAAGLARRFITIFEPYEQIVTPSASCAMQVQRHYAELLAEDGEWAARARRVAERTFEFTQFLRGRLQLDLAELLRFDEAVTYHYPCHARDCYSPGELAAWLAGSCAGGDEGPLRPPQRADLCCGFGGVFSLDLPQVSAAMMRDKLSDLAASGAELVVSNEGGCTLNLAGGARRQGLKLRFRHIAECLAESLGLMEPAS